ncbi:MAG TPA: serine hydrolase domain-containing protein [Polyangiaceae bacterium]|nr:serine hydrolase domain-containing protein [Polyangiaceae bacterium]
MPIDLLEPNEDLGAFLSDRVVEARVAPAAVAAGVARTSEGYRGVCAAAGDAHLDTVFDLASVSKPFLAVAVGLWAQRGLLSWGTRLGELLPEVGDLYAGDATLEALLSHRAGLLPHVELFAESWAGTPVDRRALLRRAASARRRPEAHDALYSDLGYLLVGAGLQRRFGRPLDALLTEVLLAPLGLAVGSARSFRAAGFGEPAFAATEIQPGRGGLLRGQVHDDNAWALAGHGWAGHAGGFGTVRGILDFGVALLEGARGEGPLSEVLGPLIVPRPGGSLRLGFDGTSGPASTSLAGPLAGPDTFGHLGFTGTSLWCDPVRGLCTVLLTNRVYPRRDNPRIRAARVETQARLAQLLGHPGPTSTRS